MSTSEKFGGFSHGGKIEGPRNVPGSSDFERVEGVGVGNAVEIGFSLGGEAGVEAGFFSSNGKRPNAGGEVEVQRFGQSGWGMSGWDFTGGHLAESVDATIRPTRSGYGNGISVYFLKCDFEGELDGGFGILSLPSKEVFAPIGEQETVRNRLHEKINGGRLRAKDYRSSR